MDKKIQHYVLFPNHDNAMRLYNASKKAGIKATISPTPRAASKCCGISLMIDACDVDAIKKCAGESDVEILKIVALELDLNPKRDRYC